MRTIRALLTNPDLVTAACGVRWREVGELIINERDRTYPDFVA